ncbi:autotransporter outer membrane beta-barrel domain-containing protein, partial [Campylobacter canadensis]|uniref:autotransporter outer membrane beta-barrel domain-containing protein n=2 Tax=Campylobacter canadensis TaxID=449520 RepID=UPI001CCE4E1A
ELDNKSQNIDALNKEIEKRKDEIATILDKIKNETKEGLAKKEEIKNSLGEFYNDNSKAATELITLVASSSNLSEEDKAQAKNLANKIATESLQAKIDDISKNATSSINVQLNNMNKRLGEVRAMGAQTGVWLRTYGGRYSGNNNHFNYYSTQIGIDKKSDLSNAELLSGALIGFDKINSLTDTKAYSIGAYFSYINNDGYFADTVLKYLNTSYSQKEHSFKKQNSFLLSMEAGYRFDIFTSSYIEPSLEFITGYVGKYEDKYKGTIISVNKYVPFVVKPQVYYGLNLDSFIFRAGLGAVVNLHNNKANLHIGDLIAGISANSSIKLSKNNHGFASIQTAYSFNENLRLNLGLERSFGTSFKQDYELNATLRYTF